MYRYDPPVLIVALTWHETKAKFCDLLRLRLHLTYFSNAESVCSTPLQTAQVDTNRMCRCCCWMSHSMAPC